MAARQGSLMRRPAQDSRGQSEYLIRAQVADRVSQAGMADGVLGYIRHGNFTLHEAGPLAQFVTFGTRLPTASMASAIDARPPAKAAKRRFRFFSR